MHAFQMHMELSHMLGHKTNLNILKKKGHKDKIKWGVEVGEGGGTGWGGVEGRGENADDYN